MWSPNEPVDFIWRIARREDLTGSGGQRVSGRWHTRPKPVVYCAADPSTSLLELLRYVGDAWLLPDDYVMLKIGVPRGLKMEIITLDDLPGGWSDKAAGYAICQPYGDDWLLSCRAPLLCVPSVTGPNRWNVLINPAHRDSSHILVDKVIRDQPFTEITRET